MVSIIGRVEPIIEETLCQEWDMERENGIWFTEIFMKVNIWTIRKMEKEHTYGKMGQNILDHFRMTIVMAMDKWLGMMEDHIKETG